MHEREVSITVLPSRLLFDTFPGSVRTKLTRLPTKTFVLTLDVRQYSSQSCTIQSRALGAGDLRGRIGWILHYARAVDGPQVEASTPQGR